jgi:hypothetical protein
VPLQTAAWMLGGLFLGLVPTIIRTLFAIDSGLLNRRRRRRLPRHRHDHGLLVGRVAPRTASRVGGSATTAGAALMILAIGTRALPLVVLSALVGGFGFGASYSGALRSITPGVEPQQMAGVFAALFARSAPTAPDHGHGDMGTTRRPGSRRSSCTGNPAEAAPLPFVTVGTENSADVGIHDIDHGSRPWPST